METKICKHCGRELSVEYFTKNRYGYTSVCKRCASERKQKSKQEHSDLQAKIDKLEQELEELKTARLNSFDPRDLIINLAERGYSGDIKYVKEFTISMTALLLQKQNSKK